MSEEKNSTTSRGKEGEKLVADYLRRKGYVILEENWRPGPGSHLEIDLIASKDMVAVFVEVKTRKNNEIDPLEAIDRKKIVNICKAADTFLRQQDFLFEYRFDIAGVSGIESGNPEIEYIEDAFMPPFANR